VKEIARMSAPTCGPKILRCALALMLIANVRSPPSPATPSPQGKRRFSQPMIPLVLWNIYLWNFTEPGSL